MNRKVIVFIATSLDGYIATENESLDWLFRVEGEGDNGYSEFYDTVDTIIMGRRTYDWIVNVEGDNFPYKNKKCYVFSKTPHQPNSNVDFLDCDIVNFLKEIKQEDGEHIWLVGGGELIHHVLKANLVDEFIITVAPQIIGAGIPLFKKSDVEIELQLTNVRRFNQFVELHYMRK
jgi:dihydrofolate reductase